MRVSARLFFGLAFLPLAGLFAFSLAYGGSPYPVGMLLPTTAIGGLLAWALTGLFSTRLRRPFGLLDAVRSAGWMVIFSAAGLGQMAVAYYRHYWPQHAPTASAIATAGFHRGLPHGRVGNHVHCCSCTGEARRLPVRLRPDG